MRSTDPARAGTPEVSEIIARLRAAPGGARLRLSEWAELLPDDDGRAGDSRRPLEVPDEALREMADHRRRELHGDGVVTFVIDRNINYTNVCTSICNFCAFYRSPGEDGGYVLSHDEIFRKVEEMVALGGSGILMQGGLHPDLPLEWYTGLLSELKRRFGIHLHCFSPTEIYGLGEVTGLGYRDVLQALMEAGLDSLPGGGGEILVDEVRRKRRSKVNSREWLEIMEVAHELDLPTTATMMFGHGEQLIHRLQHLERIRELQDRTAGFVSFILWNFQPENTPLGKVHPTRTGSDEYLRWLAVSRIYLEGIPNLQVSWLTQGLEVGRRALHWGANDLGSVMIEENVIRPAGASHEATDAVLRRLALEEGFTPIQRNAAYRRLEEVAAP
ncbi:MAG: dehypoxanthine futalosine cyclase [Planctomycetota bacterium]|nr:dehypoxanthine futalosine cyclase [Planctomycetota bacterium]